ncbi:MAG: glycerol-3-phosphate 1-O-acyltransferase PlsY [Cetobacterium sp.]|uniref:glycerol-3-phosphate 1-O-acyltransferase PlsY n=1 Tax=unclassified Cetobacterium TaxID=2630983 RepID=UPI00163BE357|nr:glycerol-3-phosphate 1-O-acyltransferase PlsY [Cetobacterium sp. 2A]MBC2856624.1 glycerol-3-phosphate 1-O-acyltransferase PlsY [Cetobacterium sp. 2A]
MLKLLVFVCITYLFGSLPSGVWIGKRFKKIDIREHGSKNSGATNAYRVLGPKYGIMVLIADVLKGYIPLVIANYFGITGSSLVFLGLVAIFGHTFSFFLNFNGGKGVATSLGVFLYLIPNVIGILVVVFILVVYFTKYISLASIICAGLLPILTIFLPMKDSGNRIPLIILTTIVGVFVIYKHKTNISRLIKGTENKFNLK